MVENKQPGGGRPLRRQVTLSSLVEDKGFYRIKYWRSLYGHLRIAREVGAPRRRRPAAGAERLRLLPTDDEQTVGRGSVGKGHQWRRMSPSRGRR